jgi:hypothetical protein
MHVSGLVFFIDFESKNLELLWWSIVPSAVLPSSVIVASSEKNKKKMNLLASHSFVCLEASFCVKLFVELSLSEAALFPGSLQSLSS